MAKGSAFATVDQGRWSVLERFRLKEFEDHTAMLFICALQGCLLPPLTLIAPKVVDIKRSVRLPRTVELSLKVNEALTCCVN
jgi:hypothetical protein